MKWKVEWSRRPLTLTLGALIGLLLVCAPAEERVIGIWSISLWKAASLQPLLRLLPPEGRGLGVRGGRTRHSCCSTFGRSFTSCLGEEPCWSVCMLSKLVFARSHKHRRMRAYVYTYKHTCVGASAFVAANVGPHVPFAPFDASQGAPAGARGLRTPKSLARARCCANVKMMCVRACSSVMRYAIVCC